MAFGTMEPQVIQGAALEEHARGNMTAVRAMSRDACAADAADPPVRVEHPGPIGLTAVSARTL